MRAVQSTRGIDVVIVILDHSLILDLFAVARCASSPAQKPDSSRRRRGRGLLRYRRFQEGGAYFIAGGGILLQRLTMVLLSRAANGSPQRRSVSGTTILPGPNYDCCNAVSESSGAPLQVSGTGSYRRGSAKASPRKTFESVICLYRSFAWASMGPLSLAQRGQAATRVLHQLDILDRIRSPSSVRWGFRRTTDRSASFPYLERFI